MNNILGKSDVEASRKETQLDTAHLRAEIVLSSQVLVRCVVNYTANYFWDLALFLFEQTVKKSLT